MTLKIYLASRYSRREELCEYRKKLEDLGHSVTSRWLNGKHQISDGGKPIGNHGESLVEGDDGSSSEHAREDVKDVEDCDLLIAFTEPPRSNASRGGRHVELGLALGLKKRIFVIGHRENIFCWLPDVEFFPTIDHIFR